jgi:hypothetical protein
VPLAAHAEARSSTPESDLPPGALALVPDAPTMASPMIKALAERCQVQVMGLAEILSELSWSTLELRIRGGEFRALLIEFPTRTFKSGLRSSQPPGIYGLDRRVSSEEIRTESLQCLRIIAVILAAEASGCQWLSLVRVRVGEPSPLDFPEVIDLLHRFQPGRRTYRAAPGNANEVWISSSFPVKDEEDSSAACGSRARAGALLSMFTYKYESAVAEELLKMRSPHLTHPSGRWNLLVPSASSSSHQGLGENVPPSSSSSSQALQHRPHVSMTVQLRGPTSRSTKLQAEEAVLGGLRAPSDAALRTPGGLVWGPQLFDVVSRFLDDRADVQKSLLSALADHVEPVFTDNGAWVKHATGLLQKAIIEGLQARGEVYEMRGPPDECQLSADLIRSWGRLYSDPGVGISEWLWDGAPAGIRHHPDESSMEPIFPKYEEGDPEPAHLLHTDFQGFSNYSGVDEQDLVSKELDGFAERSPSFLHRTDSLEEARKFLEGEDPVLSKFAVLERIRKGKVKRRVILDIKESGIRASTKRGYRILLPRTIDAINGTLSLLSLVFGADEATEWEEEEADVEYLVLDYVNAFWQIPLRPDERRFFSGRVRNRWYTYKRCAQGSRLGPFSWGAVIALTNRLMQPMFLRRQRGRQQAKKDSAFFLLLRTYVDDPLATVAGTKAQRDRAICVMVVVWLCMGFELAYPKAQRGKRAEWIGNVIRLYPDRVEVWISQEKVDDLWELISEMTSGNLVGVKKLRTFAGKASFIAALVIIWRPFLNEIWAALSSANSSRTGTAPRNCVWLSQISSSLTWMSAFLAPERNEDFEYNDDGTNAGIRRVWFLEAYLGRGPRICLTWDASPFGLGAFLTEDDVVVEYLSCAITPDDVQIFGYEVGDSAGQQSWECLAPLVALRAWRSRWRSVRIRLSARGDNMTSLQMMLALTAKGPGPSLVARELALEMGDGAYAPDLVEHTPGVANVEADMLSRRHDPTKTWSLPPVLASVPETIPPRRDRSYYWTL